MSQYTVSHAGRESGEPFANYLFDVSQDGRKIAELSHDYRGDEHWMRLPGGSWVPLSERIIEGGGPQPLYLSAAGIKAVNNLIG